MIYLGWRQGDTIHEIPRLENQGVGRPRGERSRTPYSALTTIIGTMNLAHLADNLWAAEAGPLPPEVYVEARRRMETVRTLVHRSVSRCRVRSPGYCAGDRPAPWHQWLLGGQHIAGAPVSGGGTWMRTGLITLLGGFLLATSPPDVWGAGPVLSGTCWLAWDAVADARVARYRLYVSRQPGVSVFSKPAAEVPAPTTAVDRVGHESPRRTSSPLSGTLPSDTLPARRRRHQGDSRVVTCV